MRETHRRSLPTDDPPLKTNEVINRSPPLTGARTFTCSWSWRSAIATAVLRAARKEDMKTTPTITYKKTPLITFEEAEERLRFCNSNTRLGALVDLMYEMRTSAWLKLLGRYWTVCDNISDYSLELFEGFEGYAPAKQMMTRAEWKRYQLLPDTVTIFRGCGPDNQNGLSWSLDRQVAETFPFLNRYKVDEPLLVTARVRKEDIIALKDGRGESEVITFDPEFITVEPITAERGRELLEAHARNMREERRIEQAKSAKKSARKMAA